MMCYMGCNVYFEAPGRGRRGGGRWVIRDGTWGNKLVASFSDREFFNRDIHGNSTVNEFDIIRKWVEQKKTDPEWIKYKQAKDI